MVCFCWLLGLLVRWFVGSLVCWFVGLLVCWFVGSLARWLVGLLVRWFVGLLVCWFVGSFVRVLYVCLFVGIGWLLFELLLVTEVNFTVFFTVTSRFIRFSGRLQQFIYIRNFEVDFHFFVC
jgi:hypothetical protein